MADKNEISSSSSSGENDGMISSSASSSISSSDEVDKKRKRSTKKKKSNKRQRLIEDEASDDSSEGGDSSEDDDDDDDDENDGFELDGFVVQDGEDDEDGEKHRHRRSKKKKSLKRLKQADSAALDEEDYKLMQENLGIQDEGQKSDESAASSDSEDDIVADKPSSSRPSQLRHQDTLQEYESDDMDDFIVDDDGQQAKGRVPSSSSFKKNIATNDGPTVYQMDEAEELFGEFPLSATKPSSSLSATTKSSIKSSQLYEPSVLKEHMLTEKDNVIRSTDIPERMQRDKDYEIDMSKVVEESEWICAEIFDSLPRTVTLPSGDTSSISRGEVIGAIERVLNFIHECLEVTFIATYRKEAWQYAGLTPNSLHFIKKLNLKWKKLQQKKKMLSATLENNQALMELLRSSNEEAVVKSIGEYVALEKKAGAAKVMVIRRDFYKTCRKEPVLSELASAFTLSASVLGDLLSNTSTQSTIVPNTPEESDPELYATSLSATAEIQSLRFQSATEILRGARHVAAVQVAFEPRIKMYLYKIYKSNVALSVTATEKGVEDIDEFHYLHGWQYIESLSVEGGELTPEIFVKITRAEKEGLVKTSFSKTIASILVDALSPYYLSDTSDDEWNEQRRLVLSEAVSQILLPSLEAEVRRSLCATGRDDIVAMVASAFEKRLRVRGYAPPDVEDTVAIGAYVEPNGVITLSCVDASNAVVDSATFLYESMGPRKDALVSHLTSFIKNNSDAHIVAINTSGGNKSLNVGNMIDEARKRLGRGEVSDGSYLHVAFCRDDVIVALNAEDRSVALARYVVNPLNEFARLWDNVTDISRGSTVLALNIHPLQKFVSKSVLIHELERVMVNVINTTSGMDINDERQFYRLQFICGFGPVKASAFKGGNVIIERRSDLSLSSVVYKNAAGFIRVREKGLLREVALNPLDDTRIHPESYYMAVKMCGDAVDKPTLDVDDPDKYSFVVEDVMFQSTSAALKKNGVALKTTTGVALNEEELDDPLSELDLPAYASRLESKDQKGFKLATLLDIKQELRFPFNILKVTTEYQDLTEQDLLYELNGETRDSLKIGMIVPVTLLHEAGREFVRVSLANGVRAELRKEFLPNYMDRDFLSTTGITKGMTLNAKITGFSHDNFGRYGVTLACDDHSIQDVSAYFNRYSMSSGADIRRIQEDSERRIDSFLNTKPVVKADRKKSSGRARRQISHPAFANVDCKEAIRKLAEDGDVVFRPSSLGLDHLTLSWKMTDGIYRHFDIEEKGKVNESALGKRLLLKNVEYSDLDEIVATFVSPLNDYVLDVMQHEKFYDGKDDNIDDVLKKLKTENPRSIPYKLVLSTKYPGCFDICFITSSRVHRVHVEIRSDGYRFFGKLKSSSALRDLKGVLNFFKSKALSTSTRKRR